MAAYRFAVDLYRLSVKWLLWIMALLGIVLIQVVWFYPGEYASMSRIIYPITLIPTLFLLLALKWNNRFLHGLVDMHIVFIFSMALVLREGVFC